MDTAVRGRGEGSNKGGSGRGRWSCGERGRAGGGREGDGRWGRVGGGERGERGREGGGGVDDIYFKACQCHSCALTWALSLFFMLCLYLLKRRPGNS